MFGAESSRRENVERLIVQQPPEVAVSFEIKVCLVAEKNDAKPVLKTLARHHAQDPNVDEKLKI